MRSEKEGIFVLVSEIKDELENMDAVAESLACLQGKIMDADASDRKYLLESAGLELHNFYVACERIFKKIAGEINGGLPSSMDWHTRLLNIMTLAIEDRRPPVIRKKTAEKLAEYLKFRHLLMNIYGFELQAEKILPLIKKLPETRKEFRKDMEEFLEFLKSIAV
jgi:hypothetical protein